MTTEITQSQFDNLMLDVEVAVYEFEKEYLRGNLATNWNALRLYPSGSISVVCEASESIPESEYFNKTPHPITFYSRTGDGFIPSPDDSIFVWKPVDDGQYIGNDRGEWNRVDNLDEEDIIEKLSSKGWFRFELDKEDIIDEVDVETIMDDIQPKIERWVEDGNYCPKV